MYSFGISGLSSGFENGTSGEYNRGLTLGISDKILQLNKILSKRAGMYSD